MKCQSLQIRDRMSCRRIGLVSWKMQNGVGNGCSFYNLSVRESRDPVSKMQTH